MLTTVRELGAALQRRRVDLGLSQQQLCGLAGVARSWLSKVEGGRHPGAEVQKVLDVAGALGLSVALVSAASAAPTDDSEDSEDDPFGDLFAERP